MTEKASSLVFDTIKNFILILLLIATLYPFLNILAVSFNDHRDTISGGIKLWPRIFTLENYRKLLSQPLIARASINSLLRVVIGVISGVLCNSMAAYILSKKNFVLRKQLNFLFIFTMYVSGSLMPTFFLYKKLGLINNFNVYWLPYGATAYYMILIKAYIGGISESIIDAAKVEGAGDSTIYWRIILPLSTPVLASIALFIAVDHWNSWFDTFIFNPGRKLTTLQYELQRIITTISSPPPPGTNYNLEPIKGIKSAMTIIITIPIVLTYPFFQKYFVTGLTLGGVKG